jgi:DNA-binding MarR family transcriptional regulator
MAAAKSKTLPASVSRPAESTFRELVRTFGLLERVMQSHFARFGISGAQWGVLRNLHRAEQEGSPGLRLTDLSDRLLVRPPSVTGAVDRLERAGLVERRGSPADLRAKQVGLTAKGRHLVERVLVFHGAQIDAVLSGLSPDEQTEFHRLLGRLGQHLERFLEQGPVANIG